MLELVNVVSHGITYILNTQASQAGIIKDGLNPKATGNGLLLWKITFMPVVNSIQSGVLCFAPFMMENHYVYPSF